VNLEFRIGARNAPVLRGYMASKNRVDIIRGPLGSGKTLGSVQRVIKHIYDQEPGADGVSRSRWLAIRNTYSDLFGTTIKDWLAVNAQLGKFKAGGMEPPTHTMKFKRPDGVTVEAEMIFLALDRPDSIKKLRGYQVTGFWLNETKELPKEVVDMADLRHGRYPENPTWHGMIGDTNAPDEDEWLALLEEKSPEGWGFWVQPGGVLRNGLDADGNVIWIENAHAENIHNLPDGYYTKGMGGKTDDWIAVNLANEIGSVMTGKPVHPWYNQRVHYSEEEYQFNSSLPLVIGVDFGRTPAAAFYQCDGIGRWHLFDELVTEDMSAQTFAPLIKSKVSSLDATSVRIWCDPSGEGKGQATDDTPIKILQAAGLPARPAKVPGVRDNNPTIRRAAISTPCLRNCMDGRPAFVVHKKAKMSHKALKGGFQYRRMQVIGTTRFSDEPDKNGYSHIAEAAEYGLLGEGEGRAALIGSGRQSSYGTVIAKTPFNRR